MGKKKNKKFLETITTSLGRFEIRADVDLDSYTYSNVTLVIRDYHKDTLHEIDDLQWLLSKFLPQLRHFKETDEMGEELEEIVFSPEHHFLEYDELIDLHDLIMRALELNFFTRITPDKISK